MDGLRDMKEYTADANVIGDHKLALNDPNPIA